MDLAMPNPRKNSNASDKTNAFNPGTGGAVSLSAPRENPARPVGSHRKIAAPPPRRDTERAHLAPARQKIPEENVFS